MLQPPDHLGVQLPAGVQAAIAGIQLPDPAEGGVGTQLPDPFGVQLPAGVRAAIAGVRLPRPLGVQLLPSGVEAAIARVELPSLEEHPVRAELHCSTCSKSFKVSQSLHILSL